MPTSAQQEDRNNRVRGIIGAASGNLVEWFDFYIYAVFAIYFTHALTPHNLDETTQAIYVWGVFGISFFMRPVGSWLFGSIADKYGRKRSMVISIYLMAISSFLFAALPTYDSVGVAAPLLLLVVRLLQGLSVGGEYGAVATYMSELGLKGQRGFYGSFQYFTLSGGQLLASLMGVILLSTLSEEQLMNGGWRIPFVVGGITALISLMARRRLEETLSKKDQDNKESGSLRALFSEHWRAFLLVVGYSSAGSLAFYVITVYSKTYISSLGLPSKHVAYLMTFALLIFMVAQPFFGMLADRIGRRLCMLIFSGAMFITIYPVMVWGMPYFRDNAFMVGALLVLLMLILSFYTSISGVVKAEMFPPYIRALGVGFAYAIGNAVFGGSAPSVALQFKADNVEYEFFIYMMVMMAICFACSFMLPKKSKYLD